MVTDNRHNEKLFQPIRFVMRVTCILFTLFAKYVMTASHVSVEVQFGLSLHIRIVLQQY